MTERLLVAASTGMWCVDAGEERVWAAEGLEEQDPVAVTADPWMPGRAWCAARRGGVFRSDDRGATWRRCALEGQRLTALAASPAQEGLVWAGTEPSAVWRSEDGGTNWRVCADLAALPSSSEWSYPPRPDTHHVRWIAPHPSAAEHLWVAIEAGALVRTMDGGATWVDRVAGGPHDTHELAVHSHAPDVLRSAAGDGYFESRDGGLTWSSPMKGLHVGYLRSVAIDPADPEVVVVTAATHPHSTYRAGRSDGRVYRREGRGSWRAVGQGWPDPPSTIAAVLVAGARGGELWAADERGVHHSKDGGASWRPSARFDPAPAHVEGIVLLPTDARRTTPAR